MMMLQHLNLEQVCSFSDGIKFNVKLVHYTDCIATVDQHFPAEDDEDESTL
jgi:hypothetical protein